MTSTNRFLSTSQQIDTLATEKTLLDVDNLLHSGALEVQATIVGGGSSNVTVVDIDTTAGGQTSLVGTNLTQLDGNLIDLGAGNVGLGTQLIAIVNDQVDLPIKNGTTGDITTDIARVGGNDIFIPRLRVRLPKILYKSNWGINTDTNNWTYTLNSGLGISESHSVNGRNVTINTTLDTTGDFSMRTKRRFNCNNGYSQLFTTISTNLILSGGFSATDVIKLGFFDEDPNGHGAFFELLGDNTYNIGVHVGLSTIRIPNASWNLNTSVLGTRSDNMTFFIEFNDNIVRWGQLFEGKTRYFHERFGNVVIITNFFFSPITYNISTVSPAPAIQFLIKTAKMFQEDSEQEIQNVCNFSIGNTALITNTSLHVAYTGIRYSSVVVNSHVMPVRVLSIDYSPSASSEDWVLNLLLNPGLNGVVGWTNPLTGSAIEYLDGIVTNTVATVGRILYSASFSNKGGTSKQIIVLPNPIELREGDELVLSIDSQTTQIGFARINWIEG